MSLSSRQLAIPLLTPFPLNDPELDSQALRAAQQRSTEAEKSQILADLGVTRAELALFTALHYGFNIPPEHFPRRAVREHYNPVRDPLSEEDCRRALADAIAKGWLQILDEPALNRLAAELRDQGSLGPIYGGLPDAGSVDFTPTGAKLWFAYWTTRHPNWPPSPYIEVVYEKTVYFHRTAAAASAKLKQLNDDDAVATIRGPVPIGPWRAQWWRRFDSGYRTEVEVRRQWQGICGGGQNACDLGELRCVADVDRLRDLLDRHNVTLGEWFALRTLDERWPPKRISASEISLMRSRLNLPLSENDCRKGARSCVEHGWLRRFDEPAQLEIDALLRQDPTINPLRSSSNSVDDLEFTPVGAALYRMITAEWLGADWEDGLVVTRDLCWEEHHYCTSRSVVEAILQEYIERDACIRASRIVPIGPWCVYWWEHFESGFRLEIELGEA